MRYPSRNVAVQSSSNAKTLQKAQGEESVLLNIEVKELIRVKHTIRGMAQVSRKMDNGIETFIQPFLKKIQCNILTMSELYSATTR